MFLYFNSIKVRLKLDDDIIAFIAEKFQFHKGTIKTMPYDDALTLSHISIP